MRCFRRGAESDGRLQINAASGALTGLPGARSDAMKYLEEAGCIHDSGRTWDRRPARTKRTGSVPLPENCQQRT
jgi:hypothetical protein